MASAAAISVPADVLRGIRSRWPDLAEPWSASVENELHELCHQYDATPTSVLRARFGLVVKAQSPTGPLILRSSPDPAGLHQGIVSTALADLGVAPRIRELTTTPHGTWTVMDCITPGTPLGDEETLPDLHQVVAMLRPIAGQSSPGPDLPNVVNWLRDRLTDDHLQDLAPGRQVAPRSERQHTLAVLDELAADHTPGLCHGDASPWNVLTGATDRLYLIDPRGIAGELTYDIAIIALKSSARLPLDIGARLLADALSVPVERILRWVTVAIAARV